MLLTPLALLLLTNSRYIPVSRAFIGHSPYLSCSFLMYLWLLSLSLYKSVISMVVSSFYEIFRYLLSHKFCYFVSRVVLSYSFVFFCVCALKFIKTFCFFNFTTVYLNLRMVCGSKYIFNKSLLIKLKTITTEFISTLLV